MQIVLELPSSVLLWQLRSVLYIFSCEWHVADFFENNFIVEQTFMYCILNFASVFSTNSAAVICKECTSTVTFHQRDVRELGFKISMACKCKKEKEIDSCPKIGKAYEINRRLVFVMRLLGVGYEGYRIFCGLMDMGQGFALNTYYPILENIHSVSSAVLDTVLSIAVNQEKEVLQEQGKAENIFTVSGDGTWKKRIFIFIRSFNFNYKVHR